MGNSLYECRVRHESDLDNACRAVVEEFGIDPSDCLLALAFGSRARNQEASTSDFDIILFVRPEPAYPEFAYRRLKLGDRTIDANIIQPASLDRVCRKEAGWAYRLYRARVIPGFTGIAQHLADAWLGRVDALIRHPLACRRRLLWHLADCRALLRNAQRLQTTSPVLSTYLMIEAMFQVPLIHLNLLGLVPFETGDPWSSARDADPTLDAVANADFQSMFKIATSCALGGNLASDGAFGRRLKHIRDRCRHAVIGRLGYVFHDGFGKTLAKKARADNRLLSDLSEILSGVPAPGDELNRMLMTWTGKAQGRAQQLEARVGERVSIARRKNRITGTRLVDYYPDTARLKVILPTGGCRVPTCSFCMLPYLARAKTSAEQVFRTAAHVVDKRPVHQLSVYTDGSFFDEREVSSSERLSIADRARRWGARELLVESLPRFLEPRSLEEVIRVLGPTCRLRIGVGLQSTDALVRRHITGTPITQSELVSLLKLRRAAPLALRLYLLANKPMMSLDEDMLDLERSLQLLDLWLAPEDVVTINPLLPTRATRVEQLEKFGYWRPLGVIGLEYLVCRLQAKARKFSLEFGPLAGATCTERNPGFEFGDPFPGLLNERVLRDGIDVTGVIPWSLLGGYRSRGRWATTGGYANVAAISAPSGS